mgnify:CR=1 FL=1
MMIGFRYLTGFFFQAEDGIRDLVRSRGLGDVYKRQIQVVLWIYNMNQTFEKTNEVQFPPKPNEFDITCDLSLIHI